MSVGRVFAAAALSVAAMSFSVGCDDSAASTEDETAVPSSTVERAQDELAIDRLEPVPGPPRCTVEDRAGSCRLERCGFEASDNALPEDRDRASDPEDDPSVDEDPAPVVSELEMPRLPVVTAPRAELSSHPRSRDLLVEWEKVEARGSIRVMLTNEPDLEAKEDRRLGSARGEGPRRLERIERRITCEVPVEDGAVAIPARLLETFPETETDPALRVIFWETQTVADNGGDWDVHVGWYALTPAGADFERTLRLDGSGR